MRTAELVADVAWVVLGLGICLYAVRLRLWDAATGPGSGFMPLIAGLFVTLIGLGLAGRAWAERRRRAAAPPFWEDAGGRNRVGLVVLALCAMAFLLPPLGFVLAAAVVMTFLLGLSDPRRLGSAVVLAVASVLAVHALFGWLLQVRLPRGPLGF